MGCEDEIISFETLKETLVFWNMDDYPIPVDNTDDLGPTLGDIFKALHIMGFRRGFMDVILYSEQHNYDKKGADIIQPCLPQWESYTGSVFNVPDITLDMICHAACLGSGPVNFLVIAKPKRELHRVLQCLKSRRHNVLLVEPPLPDEEFLFSVDSLLENTRLFGGGKPRYNPLHRPMYERDSSFENSVEIKEDVFKTVDFSERIPTVKGVRTAVFWDAVDCPFPPSSTPDQIYHSISSFLMEREFSDKITIWAYLDDDNKGSWSGDKTWASRIYFLPGDKASRRIRMLNDIYLWQWDSPRLKRSYEASVILVSDQFKDDDVYYRGMLQRLGNRDYHVVLVTPTLDINKPENPEWPGLLIDGGAYFFDKITKHESDDDAEEETPEELPIMSDMDYSLSDPFGDQASDSPETEEGRQFWKPLTYEDMLIDGGPSSEEPPLYRWDPHTLMYKLASLFPKEHEAAVEETPLYLWDPHTQMMSKLESLSPFPKEHEAAEEETPERLATHGTITPNMNKLKSSEWPGRQIDGGSGWGSSEEPFLKHKPDAAEEAICCCL